MYVLCCVGSAGGHLTGPVLSLTLVSLAVLTGINRVVEYRNHWSDVIAGQAVGGAIAVFLVSLSSVAVAHHDFERVIHCLIDLHKQCNYM